MKDRIKELLGVPLPANVVADAVGCTESYISQLMSDESFAQEVQSIRTKNLAQYIERDKKYDSLEDQLLEKLEGLLHMVSNPMAVVNALKMVNTAKRRAAPAELAGATTKHQHVHLHLPSVIQQQFIVNGQNQVIEVGDKTIATMPASAVVKKLEEMKRNSEVNVIEHEKDKEEAQERLESLKKIDYLPVHALL